MQSAAKVLVFGFALGACLAVAVEGTTPPITAANDFIGLLNDGKFDAAQAKCDAAMQQALPAEKLQSLWRGLIQKRGALKQQGEGHVQKVGDYQVVDTVCKFEKADLTLRISFDKDQHVAGLFLLPATKPDTPPKDNPNAIQLQTKTGTLYGTLDLPIGKGPWPVVVIVAGSGPTDRDGNQTGMTNDSLKLLGQALAKHGIAALRYDKRGVGQSAAAAPKEADMRFDMLVDDAAGWVEKLHHDARFTKVGLLGHSEGSLIAILAAQQSKVDVLISLEGAGRNIGILLREQMKSKSSPEQFQQLDHILSELAAGRTVDDIPNDLLILFRPSVQPYIISWLKYDPAKELAKLQMPILIVQGTTDLQTSAEANKRAQLVTIKNMNHVLKHTEATELSGQVATYTDPSLPLEPKSIEAVMAFLDQALAGQKK